MHDAEDPRQSPSTQASAPVTHERLRPGLGCSLPGLAGFPWLRRFTRFLRSGLRLRKPHGAGITNPRGGWRGPPRRAWFSGPAELDPPHGSRAFIILSL